MKPWLPLALLLLSTPVLACEDAPLDLSINQLRNREPTIYVNGSLRISLGTSPGRVVDIYSRSNEPFEGLMISRESREDHDDRSWVIRTLFPRELAPTQYFLLITLSDEARAKIQGKRDQLINLSVLSGEVRTLVRFYVSSDLSPNCRPQVLPNPKASPKKPN